MKLDIQDLLENHIVIISSLQAIDHRLKVVGLTKKFEQSVSAQKINSFKLMF